MKPTAVEIADAMITLSTLPGWPKGKTPAAERKQLLYIKATVRNAESGDHLRREIATLTEGTRDYECPEPATWANILRTTRSLQEAACEMCGGSKWVSREIRPGISAADPCPSCEAATRKVQNECIRVLEELGIKEPPRAAATESAKTNGSRVSPQGPKPPDVAELKGLFDFRS